MLFKGVVKGVCALDQGVCALDQGEAVWDESHTASRTVSAVLTFLYAGKSVYFRW